MDAFIMHVGSVGSIDLDFTVRKTRSVSEILEHLPVHAPERTFFEEGALQEVFPGGIFNCWGVPVGAEPSFQKTHVGDVVLFIPEIGDGRGVEYLGVVKAICPFQCYEASRILWPETPDERLFPWLFFFATEAGHIPWNRFLAELNYAPNWNPRGWYRRIGSQRFRQWDGASGYLNYIRRSYRFTPIVAKQAAEQKEQVYSTASARSEVDEAVETISEIAGKRRKSAGQGFKVSPKHRRAIERASLQMAIDYFANLGWSVEDVSQQESYDLRCKRGTEILYVEVKGTTSSGSQVLLTPNEVSHTRDYYPKVALFIVSDLQVNDVQDDVVEVTGGATKIFLPWEIRENDLRPLGYIYQIPSK